MIYKKNKGLWIGGAIILSLILLVIFLSKEPKFNTITFPDNPVIVNRTTSNFLDTIVAAGLTELQVDDSIYISIVPLNGKVNLLFESSTIEIKAYITNVEHIYTIFIKDNLSRYESIKVLSHELVHLHQYYRKELKVVNFILPIWKGDTMQVLGNYYERPWEEEAFRIAPILEQKIKSKLVK